jgi:hypothetical protein
MPGGAVSDFKLGFWVGLGIVLALAVWALAQGLIGKLTGHGG